jgi:hypothetical protein
MPTMCIESPVGPMMSIASDLPSGAQFARIGAVSFGETSRGEPPAAGITQAPERNVGRDAKAMKVSHWPSGENASARTPSGG